MAKIIVKDDYFIETCDYKYTLYKDLGKTDKQGNDMKKFVGDYSDLDQAIVSMFKYHLLDEINKKDIWKIDEVRQLIVDMRKELKNEFKI